VKASVLYAGDMQVQALPALRKGKHNENETGSADSRGPLAQRQSRSPLNSWFRGSNPRRPTSMRHWRNGKRFCLLSRRSGFDSSVTRLMLRWSNGYLARPSTWRLPVRAWHGALAAPSCIGKITALQAVEQGPSPCGVTAGVVEQYHAGLITRRRRANRTPATNLAWPKGRAADC
jgi:hypothetical protein